MRARYEKILPNADRSFQVMERRLERFDAPWHFHPEVELTFIASSRGRRFVGDSILPFEAGDLVLLGPNLPHFWHNEGEAKDPAHSIVVQFPMDFLGNELLSKPELRSVRKLLDAARRGLCFPSAALPSVTGALRRLPKLKGFRALMTLLEVLEQLAQAKSRPLASLAYATRLDETSSRRLARVFQLLAHRYSERMSLAEIARTAAMSPAAFSRFFKRASGKNLSVVLTELRIGSAARLLQETDSSVAEIALNCGFPTLSNFNRQFRRQHNASPREYRLNWKSTAGI